MAFSFTPYQIIVPLVALFFVTYAWNHVFRGTKTFWEAVLWTLFWGSIAFIVLFPGWMDVVTAWTGVQDRANAVFSITLGLLLFLVFHIFVRLERIQNRITEVVRHEALKEAGLSEDHEKPKTDR